MFYFPVLRHLENNMVVTSLPSLGQGKTLNASYIIKKNLTRNFFFAITIRRVRTFYTYKKPTTDMYTLILDSKIITHTGYYNHSDVREVYTIIPLKQSNVYSTFCRIENILKFYCENKIWRSSQEGGRTRKIT